jgi:hypothetical protein
MNERIRQLLLEAQALAREQVKNTPELAKYAPSYAIPGTEIHVGLGLSYEKFAELIVQKCADIGEQYADGNYEVPNQILEYFGMQEPEE